MNRILITGSQGALGTYLVRSLLQRNAAPGSEIFCLTRRATRTQDSKDGLTYVTADCLDETAMNSILGDIRPDTIFHLAWETAHGDYWESSSNKDWSSASIGFARQFAEYSGRQFIFAGTCAEYEWGGKWLDEATTPENPATRYGREKLRVSRALNDLNSSSDTNFATGRIFFPYSELENKNRITSVLVRKILEGQPLDLRAGDVFRSICHTRHIAQAMVAMAKNGANDIINLVPQHPSHLGRFLMQIARQMGRPDLLSWQEWNETSGLTTEPRHLCANGISAEQHFPSNASTKNDITQFINASVERFS